MGVRQFRMISRLRPMIDPKAPSMKDSVWLRAAAGWNRWTDASANRGIFAAAVTIGVFTVLAKIVTVAKDLVVARTFGTSDAVDAFLIALLLPSFAIAVVAGSLNSALIPVFVRVRDAAGAGQRLLSNLTLVSLALLGALMFLMAVLSPVLLSLLGSGFSAEKMALTRALYFMLIPTLVIYGLSTTWSAVLNAERRFALASLTPGITPAATIGALTVLGFRWGIYSLAAGTLGGLFLEAVVLGWALKRRGFDLRPRWHGLDPATREVIWQFAPLVAGGLLMSGSTVINQSMAAVLGSGSVATLNYGNKIITFTIGVGSLAIGTAVLPFFSRMIAAADWAGTRHTFHTYVRLLAIITIPLTLLLVWTAEPLTRLLFERGNFTAADTRIVSRVMICYTFQLPFYMIGIVGVRLLNALGKGRSVMIISVVNLIANVAGNYLLMRPLGVAGIAASTTTVYFVSCLQILFVTTRELRRREGTHS